MSSPVLSWLFWIACFILLSIESTAQFFPQKIINKALQDRWKNEAVAADDAFSRSANSPASGVYTFMKNMPIKINEIQTRLQSAIGQLTTDTIFVGVFPGDTLFITGTFVNTGPLIVFNDGVVIMENANATIVGDIYVFQNGKLFADSSIINCPQQYFYHHGIIVANDGFVNISNSTLDYGGLSHSLTVVNDAEVVMNNITNIGFTTAGAFNNSSISINTTNQAGEFIMTDSASFNFTNANTVLLWHHVPNNGVMNVSFPTGTTVPSYIFNDSQPGVTGIEFDVQLTNCTDVMWALMPEDGSDVTISGSALRAIGLWFLGNDTTNVSGLVNNSNYTTFTAPLSDRILQLNNTSVQTWSLYMFESAQVNISGCIVGEVGSMGTSFVVAQGILCDGSGGYYWSNDTSLNIAISSTILGYFRSQGNGISLLGYGSATAGASALNNSVMVVTQSSLPFDPVAYDNGVAWLVHINPPQTAFADSIVHINGSAWIKQGPQGSFISFGSYSLAYAPVANPLWIPIVTSSSNEVHNDLLGIWDTHGLVPGTYNLRLNTFNDLGDSIDAVIQVNLLPLILGENEVTPSNQFTMTANYESGNINLQINNKLKRNEMSLIEVIDVLGVHLLTESIQLIQGKQTISIPASHLASGNYLIRINTKTVTDTTKVIIRN